MTVAVKAAARLQRGARGRERVLGGEPGGEQRHQHEHHDHREAEDPGAVAAELAPEAGEAAHGGRACGGGHGEGHQ